MSYSYDRYERTVRRSQPASSRRGAFSYWIPLALTVTVATFGIAAWIWSERQNDEDDEPPPGDQVRPDYGRNVDGSIRAGPPSYAGGDLRPGETGFGTTQQRPEETQSYMARMSGALRRTPSPQQFMEGASRSVVAGVAAAGAVVGSALSSIREEDKNAYKDHKTWSEEAESRLPGVSPGPGGIELRSASKPEVSPMPRASYGSVSEPGTMQRVSVGNGKRKTVAIVVSADTSLDDIDEDEGSFHEHAVISPTFGSEAQANIYSPFSPISLEIPIFPRSDFSFSYMHPV